MAECRKCHKPLIVRDGKCVYCGEPIQGGPARGVEPPKSSWVKEMTTYKVESGPAGTRLEDMPRLGITKENNQWALANRDQSLLFKWKIEYIICEHE